VNTALVHPADEEEMALTLNGRKKKLTKQDFVAAMNTLKLEEKQQEMIFNKMAKAWPQWQELIDRSFMSIEFKEQYKSLLKERMNRSFQP
jgi:serine/threonine-protein kinase HipA